MAATVRSVDALINETTGLYKDNTAGDISASDLRDGAFSWYRPQGICQGRLTLESNVPVSTTDQTAKPTVYFTPYNGNCVGLYDGTSWTLHTFTELTLALGTLTSDKNYDVFLYNNSGTLTLELSAAWTNDTTRADALTTQDGVYVKSGVTTRLYLGTFRTVSTTTTELVFGGADTAARIFLWNLYNQVEASLFVYDTTDSWTHSTTSWRQRRASANNQVGVVNGVAGNVISLVDLVLSSTDGAAAVRRMAFGYDSTTAITGVASQVLLGSGISVTSTTALTHRPGLGYHYYAILEQGAGAGTQTFFGDAGVPTSVQGGTVGRWRY